MVHVSSLYLQNILRRVAAHSAMTNIRTQPCNPTPGVGGKKKPYLYINTIKSKIVNKSQRKIIR